MKKILMSLVLQQSAGQPMSPDFSKCKPEAITSSRNSQEVNQAAIGTCVAWFLQLPGRWIYSCKTAESQTEMPREGSREVSVREMLKGGFGAGSCLAEFLPSTTHTGYRLVSHSAAVR